MSVRNFDGGVKFVIKRRGSAITSLTLTLPYSIYYKTNSFSITKSIFSSILILPSLFTSYSNFRSSLYFTSSTNSFYNSNSTSSIISFSSSFTPIYFNQFSIFYISIIIFITSTGVFNITITPRGIIITNLSLISIFIITIIPILTIIPIILHPRRGGNKPDHSHLYLYH